MTNFDSSLNCTEIVFVNENITRFLVDSLGQRCAIDEPVALATEIIYSVILFLGVVGNLATCLVIVKDTSMHTATNYYLFSLAVSDLLTLVLGLPLELYQTRTPMYPYTLPEFVCKARAFISETTSYASILTITAFSVERWVAICHPFCVQSFSRLSRAVKIIVGVWIFSVTCASPVVYFFKINRVELPVGTASSPELSRGSTATTSRVVETHTSDYTDATFAAPTSGGDEPFIVADVRDIDAADMAQLAVVTESDGSVRYEILGTDICYLDRAHGNIQVVLINYSFWLFFVGPIVLMTLLYSHMTFTLNRDARKRKLDTESHRHDSRRRTRSRKVIIRMLVAVVVAFFICWLPFHIQRISTLYVHQDMLVDDFMNKLLTLVYYTSGYFYYSNSAVNPVLYSILNRKFRLSFVSLLCGLVGRTTSPASTAIVTGTNFRRSKPVKHSKKRATGPGPAADAAARRPRYKYESIKTKSGKTAILITVTTENRTNGELMDTDLTMDDGCSSNSSCSRSLRQNGGGGALSSYSSIDGLSILSAPDPILSGVEETSAVIATSALN